MYCYVACRECHRNQNVLVEQLLVVSRIFQGLLNGLTCPVHFPGNKLPDIILKFKQSTPRWPMYHFAGFAAHIDTCRFFPQQPQNLDPRYAAAFASAAAELRVKSEAARELAAWHVESVVCTPRPCPAAHTSGPSDGQTWLGAARRRTRRSNTARSGGALSPRRKACARSVAAFVTRLQWRRGRGRAARTIRARPTSGDRLRRARGARGARRGARRSTTGLRTRLISTSSPTSWRTIEASDPNVTL